MTADRRSLSWASLLCVALLVTASCRSDEAAAPDARADIGGDRGVLFLVQSAPAEAVMEALYEGRVAVDAAGCVRLAGPDPATVVWPYGFRLDGDRVLARDGRVVGSLGGGFRLGGGEVPSLSNGVPLEEDRQAVETRCPGRYWIVGDVP